MTARETTSAVPLVVLAVVAFGLVGYLGWRVYDRPVDEHSAERVAVRATDILMRAGGGDATLCTAMREVSAPDDAEASVQRCEEVAGRAASGVAGAAGWLGPQGLQATVVDVGRHSGSVTVSGTLQTRGPAFPLSVTWPIERVDDAWVLSGAPDVQIG